MNQQEKLQVCDRCGKKFQIRTDGKVVIGNLPSRVSIKELGGKVPQSYLLCPTCTGHVKNFIGIFSKNTKKENKNGN